MKYERILHADAQKDHLQAASNAVEHTQTNTFPTLATRRST